MAKDFVRLRCPFCGSMPYPGQLDNTQKTKEPEVRVILMRVGGKAPQSAQDIQGYAKKGKGSAKGLIEYLDVTAENPALVEKYTRWFAERAVLFAEKNGLIDKG